MKMDIGNIGKQTYSYCKTTKQTATRNNKLKFKRVALTIKSRSC